MFFKPNAQRLNARRLSLEDEIRGHLIARKAPPGRLMQEASRLRVLLAATDAPTRVRAG